MSEQTQIAAKYARALADPARVGIVAALDSGPRTAASLARELDMEETVVARHARALDAMGLVQQTEGTSRTYELLRQPITWISDWEELPLPVRRSAAAITLAQLHASASAAVDSGGFDRGDMLLTRTTMPATPERWTAMSQALQDALQRLGELDEEAKADAAAGPVEQATAVLMLFTPSHPEAGAEHPVPDFDEDEARERTYELVEELDRAMIGLGAPPWGQIAAVAEQLRLVARAAEYLDSANQPAKQESPRG